jgi:Ca2+-binding EF-hand superfamily protein
MDREQKGYVTLDDIRDFITS